MIKSMRDGTYRRYYRARAARCPSRYRRRYSRRSAPTPAPEGELAERMGLSRQVLDYHLNSLIDSGHVRLERRGKRNLAYATQVAA